jgi:serine/threonine protein phosphatase PrpC
MDGKEENENVKDVEEEVPETTREGSEENGEPVDNVGSMTDQDWEEFFGNGENTLKKNSRFAEFLRSQAQSLDEMSLKTFKEKYEEFLKETQAKEQGENQPDAREMLAELVSPMQRSTPHYSEGCLEAIVLKFTTLADRHEVPSFYIDTEGGTIGSSPQQNEVSIPNDAHLNDQHARLSHYNGAFFLENNSRSFPAAIRISVGNSKRVWPLEHGASFCIGNSSFEARYQWEGKEEEEGKGENGKKEEEEEGKGENGKKEEEEGKEEGQSPLILHCNTGAHVGKSFPIQTSGATLGRSSNNTITVPDKELSRRHACIEFDARENKFFLCDMGSTNGTYMHLVGPYGGRRKLNLSDHFLVGRTGFSVNRFDYACYEEMGFRKTMEDACAIVQHLNIAPLARIQLSPQSFYAVYDGHAGMYASHFLSQHLHINVAAALQKQAPQLLRLLEGLEDAEAVLTQSEEAIEDQAHRVLNEARFNGLEEISLEEEGEEGEEGKEGKESEELSNLSDLQRKRLLDRTVKKLLIEAFLKTDEEFLTTSEHANNGSTATTALVLGKRLYCANVGDSRTVLCRNFTALEMSIDQKPNREDESRRIKEAGGFVIHNRVMGELAVSRAFGDCEFKKGIQMLINDDGGMATYSDSLADDGIEKDWSKPLVIAEPEVQALTLTDEDQFLLLACDGLYDVFTSQEAVDVIRAEMERHGDVQRACQSLVIQAIRDRGSRDNVSVIIVILNPWFKQQQQGK